MRNARVFKRPRGKNERRVKKKESFFKNASALKNAKKDVTNMGHSFFASVIPKLALVWLGAAKTVIKSESSLVFD